MTVIPYYCGPPDAPAVTASCKAMRLRYLAATLAHARGHSDRVVVGVCDAHDREAVLSLGVAEVDCWKITLEKPYNLAVALCMVMQRWAAASAAAAAAAAAAAPGADDPDERVFCFTEADQATNLGEEHVAFLRGRPDSERAYLSGHRIEECYGAQRGNLRLLDRNWVLVNERIGMPREEDTQGWYKPKQWVQAYSAFFACTGRTLAQVRFALYGPPGPAPHGWSLESASKSMFHSGTCYKSRAVEVEGRGRLLTLHLGGHEARVRAAVGEERLAASILDGTFEFVTFSNP